MYLYNVYYHFYWYECLSNLDASGNVSLSMIADIPTTGIDYISVGALTKDIKAVDLSLRIELG